MTTPFPRSLRSRVVWTLGGYFAVSVGVLTVLVLQAREDALVGGEKLVSSFARLADEQTTSLLQRLDQLLTIAEVRLASGPLDKESVRADLEAMLRDRSYALNILVADESGRLTYASSSTGLDLSISDRSYFRQSKERLGTAGVGVGKPVLGQVTGQWIIPVYKARRNSDGSFAGVIVAAADARYLDGIWTQGAGQPDLTIGLLQQDGTMLMRSPFLSEAMGASFPESVVKTQVAAGQSSGFYQATSSLDGRRRLIAFRKLDGAAAPGLVVVAGQPVNSILATWWRFVWMVLGAWAFGTAVLFVLARSLAKEWRARTESERRYRMMFDANPEALAVFHRKTLRFLDLNDAALAQFGLSREEALAGAGLAGQADRSPLAAALTNGPGSVVRTVKTQHTRNDGRVIDVESSVRSIEFRGEPALLVLARDVTERNRLERERQAVEEELRQSQRMDAVGKLTGGVAHDLNNILMVIMANTENLEEIDLPDDARESVEHIDQATQRARDLTHQLLAFSRKQPLRPQPTDVNDLVVSTGKLLRRTLGEQVEMDSILGDGVWRVNVDRAQLGTALVNLCVNARDAMPGGGRLLIETRNTMLDEDYADANPNIVAGPYTLISVSDTGAGMPPEILAKVFEPFFTTKPVGKGTGLGLSMVYGFIKQSNGHIKIYSEVGRGTTIKMYLPRIDGDLRQDEEARLGAIPSGKERVLVIEDDAQVRGSIARQLRSLGYDVTEAADGAAALDIFAAAAVPFDLLLTDVIMPGPMNGKALADEVLRRWPGTPVIFMSGYTEDAIVHHGRLDPGVLLLSKPFHKRDLARLVREALDAVHADGR